MAVQLNAARIIGIASVALGVAALLAPQKVERVLGVSGSRPLRIDGAREVIQGLGAMVPDHPATPVWMKAANHLLEAVMLVLSLRSSASASPDGQVRSLYDGGRSMASGGGKGLLDTLLEQRSQPGRAQA